MPRASRACDHARPAEAARTSLPHTGSPLADAPVGRSMWAGGSVGSSAGTEGGVLVDSTTPTLCSLAGASVGCQGHDEASISSAARSPIATDGAYVLDAVTVGMIDASATRSPSTP